MTAAVTALWVVVFIPTCIGFCRCVYPRLRTAVPLVERLTLLTTRPCGHAAGPSLRRRACKLCRASTSRSLRPRKEARRRFGERGSAPEQGREPLLSLCLSAVESRTRRMDCNQYHSGERVSGVGPENSFRRPKYICGPRSLGREKSARFWAILSLELDHAPSLPVYKSSGCSLRQAVPVDAPPPSVI